MSAAAIFFIGAVSYLLLCIFCMLRMAKKADEQIERMHDRRNEAPKS